MYSWEGKVIKTDDIFTLRLIFLPLLGYLNYSLEELFPLLSRLQLSIKISVKYININVKIVSSLALGESFPATTLLSRVGAWNELEFVEGGNNSQEWLEREGERLTVG